MKWFMQVWVEQSGLAGFDEVVIIDCIPRFQGAKGSIVSFRLGATAFDFLLE